MTAAASSRSARARSRPVAVRRPARRFSALIAWIQKVVIVRFGGVNFFKSMKPFFLGLILGEVVISGIWGVIYPLTTERVAG